MFNTTCTCGVKHYHMRQVFLDNVGATVDCGRCGTLLIVTKKGLRDFHETMNAINKSWPKDGKNTGYIK